MALYTVSTASWLRNAIDTHSRGLEYEQHEVCQDIFDGGRLDQPFYKLTSQHQMSDWLVKA